MSNLGGTEKCADPIVVAFVFRQSLKCGGGLVGVIAGHVVELDFKRPFACAHDGFACAVLRDAIDIHFGGADHEIDVDETLVAAC